MARRTAGRWPLRRGARLRSRPGISRTGRLWLAWASGLAVLLAAASGFAQTFELAYDASLGTLPSAQGWIYVGDDPAPDDGLDESIFSVGGGVLTMGHTGGPNDDLGNVQYYAAPPFDFSFQEDALEVAIRARVIASTPPSTIPQTPVSGFNVHLTDSTGASVAMVLGESEVFLTTVPLVGSSIPRVYDTTAQMSDYVLRVDRDGATLSIDGQVVGEIQTQSLPSSNPDTNRLSIGDLWDNHMASAEIESIHFSRVEQPEAVARNVTLVSASFPSSGTTLHEAEGTVQCPTGSRALSGGVHIPSHTGPFEEIIRNESRPEGPRPYAAWRGRASAQDPFVLEVNVLCGEVPQHQLIVEGDDLPIGPLQCKQGSTALGADFSGDGPDEPTPHVSCADRLDWIRIRVTTEYDADPYKEVNALCPVQTRLIGGFADVLFYENYRITESYPETVFSDQPVLWVASAHGDPLDPTEWALEAEAVCTPAADPTEIRIDTVGRWQGSEFGAFDDLGRHDGELLNGADGVPGLDGFAFEFEPVNDEWIRLAATNTFYPKGDFTVDAWIQTDHVDPSGVGHVIAELYELGGVPGGDEAHTPNWWTLMLTPDGYLEGRVRRQASTPGTFATGDVDLADGQPHHVAMQRSGIIVRIFVDGVMAAETTIQNSWDVQPFEPQVGRDPDPVSIGARRDYEADTTSAHWDGLIDDVKYHARGLTPEEIAEIAGCGLPIWPRTLNVSAVRHGAPAGASDQLRLCAWLEPGTYTIELLSADSDPEARYTAWAEGPGQPWKTRVEVKPEIDADFGFGDATGAATEQDAFVNTSPATIPFTLTAPQRVYFGIEETGAVLDNRGGVSFRIEPVPEPGFVVASVLGVGLIGLFGRRREHRRS